MNNLQELARAEIVAMQAYQSARSSIEDDNMILLDANEVGHGNYNRYPVPQSQKFIAQVSQMYRVTPDKVLLTRGSDEAIDVLIRTFCRPYKDKIVTFTPTYGVYKVAAKINANEVIEIPLTDSFSRLPVEEVKKLDLSIVKVIFVCNPNNPTGTYYDCDQIAELLEITKGKSMVAIDEAYIDFCDQKSWANYLDEYPHLVILKTFSKAWGAAGLRLGLALGNVDAIQLFKKVLAPYPLSTPTLELANKLIANPKKSLLEKIKIRRKKLHQWLIGRPYIASVFPSWANFVLFCLKDKKEMEVYDYLLKNKLALRVRPLGEGHNALRVSIGSEKEIAVFCQKLDSFYE